MFCGAGLISTAVASLLAIPLASCLLNGVSPDRLRETIIRLLLPTLQKTQR